MRQLVGKRGVVRVREEVDSKIINRRKEVGALEVGLSSLKNLHRSSNSSRARIVKKVPDNRIKGIIATTKTSKPVDKMLRIRHLEELAEAETSRRIAITTPFPSLILAQAGRRLTTRTFSSTQTPTSTQRFSN